MAIRQAQRQKRQVQTIQRQRKRTLEAAQRQKQIQRRRGF
jgi:hypothetical protein